MQNFRFRGAIHIMYVAIWSGKMFIVLPFWGLWNTSTDVRKTNILPLQIASYA